MTDHPTNYLTVDVEDYFQVAAFDKVILPETWNNFECRVVENTQVVLRLFASHGVKATFFVVGWIAEHYPELVREIVRHGHEIGCHSYGHRKIYDLTPEEFEKDTRLAKEILEQIMGRPVYGYRAPSYSITSNSLWALDILADLGFQYDSSIFPVYHDNYGIPDAPRFPYCLEKQGMMEYPISTARIFGQNLPIAGGGYFRFFPYWFTRRALRRINGKERQPFIFYFHPWEVDPGQPRVPGASTKSRFRHYLNLDKTIKRLQFLLQDFSFQPITVSAVN